jgi:phage regulator Rha-like protein
MRDIGNLISELGDELKIEPISYTDKMNRKQKAYNLDRESALLLTSGYSAQLRLKIIRRLDELESGRSVPQITPPTKASDQAQVLALPTNYKEALLALVAKEDETDHLKQANLQLNKTKQLISSKREASVMGKLGQATQEIKRLKVELEESKAKEFSVLSKPRRMGIG